MSYNFEWNTGAGTTFYELIGQTVLNPSPIYTVSTLTSGTLYQFRYRLVNIFGYSAYSPISSIFCAKVPDQVATPTLSYVDKSVRINWDAPNTNANPISSYTILLRAVDGTTWLENEFDCDGSSPAIVAALSCTIPMLTLQAPPFNLVLGSSIQVKIAATNIIG